MEIKGYYSEEEGSSLRFSCADEAIGEVKNLFFQDQLIEEQILVEIYSPNNGASTHLDLQRLNIDRVFSKRQISNRFLFRKRKLVDAMKFPNNFSVETILEIKKEQRRLGVEFKGYFALLPRGKKAKLKEEPLLFALVGDQIYYLLNDFLIEDKKVRKSQIQKFLGWIKNAISTKTFSK